MTRCSSAWTRGPADELWEVQIGDTMEGFNVTSPPLIVKDKILIGHAGAEYAMRGYLDAYDLNGNRLWRFYTIPAAGEPGSDTWKGDSYKTGGGSTGSPGRTTQSSTRSTGRSRIPLP